MARREPEGKVCDLRVISAGKKSVTCDLKRRVTSLALPSSIIQKHFGKDVGKRAGREGQQTVAALLRRVTVGDSALCPQVDVSILIDYPRFPLTSCLQVGEFYGMFPGILQGGGRPRAWCIQHALETHGIDTGGTLRLCPLMIFSAHIVPGSNGQIL